MAHIRIVEDELTFAMEDNADDHAWYLDLVTGEVILAPDDIDVVDEEQQEVYDKLETDTTRYRLIEAIPSYTSYNIMADYADSLPDSPLKERLFRALNARHPFRSFKDTLCENEEVRQGYFAFRDELLLEFAHEWLEDEEIDAELVARSVVPIGEE